MATIDQMPGSYAAIQANSTPSTSAIPATTQGLPTVNPNQNVSGVTPTASAGPISTTQPSPTNPVPTNGSIVDTLKASGQASDFASRAKLATSEGITNYTGTADQNTQLLQKYTQGLANAQKSNTPVPQSQGDASAAVTDITGGVTPPPPVPSPVETALNNDPGYQQLLQDQKDYLSAQNQTETLQKQYTDLTNQAGIPALNTQLINMKSIMDGTEQDIRNEITKAGGFATDSQVLALTSARNKTMIQNYNNLLQTRDDLVNQVNTTMGFAKDDATNATALASEKMGFDQKVSDFYQKAQTNAADAYNKIVATPGYGYQALYKSTGGDANAISMIEKTMGLPAGSLAQLGTIPPDVKTQVVKLDNGASVLINSQTGQTIKNLGGNTSGPTTPGTLSAQGQAWVTAVLNGNATMAQVPAAYKNEVALGLTNQPADSYSPLASSRFATASNRIVSNFVNLPQYQLTANGLPYIQKIDAAIKNPGSVTDQELLDSITKLSTAGNAISDAQVKLVTGGQSFSDMVSTFENKFANGGVLSDKQRTDLKTIAHDIFDSYKKGYQPVYDQATSQLQAAGIPKAFWTIPDLNNLSGAQTDTQDTSSPSQLPQDIQTKISTNLTFSPDGKTAYIPRSVWSTFGSSMDAVLKEAQNEGFNLLVK